MRTKGAVNLKTTKKRSERFTMRCTPEFKQLLSLCSEARQDDGHSLWTETDVIHLALVDYAHTLKIKHIPEIF